MNTISEEGSPRNMDERENSINIKTQDDSAKIETINGDSLKSRAAIKRLIDLLKRENVDISCVQETHNDSIEVIEERNYMVIFGGNKLDGRCSLQNRENKRAGVSIAIEQELMPFIKNINRINGRIAEI